MDEEAIARELDYGISMAVQTLVEAMGMIAENQYDIFKNFPPTYREEDFKALIEKNGVHHNAVLARWKH